MTPRYPSIFSAPPRKMPARPDRTVAANAVKRFVFTLIPSPLISCNDYTRRGGKRIEAMAELFSTGNASIKNGAIFKLSASGRWEGIWSWKGKHGAGGFSYSFCQTSLRAARGNFTVTSHSGQGTRGIFYIIVTKRLSKAGIIRFRSEAGGEFSGPALLFS